MKKFMLLLVLCLTSCTSVNPLYAPANDAKLEMQMLESYLQRDNTLDPAIRQLLIERTKNLPAAVANYESNRVDALGRVLGFFKKIVDLIL